MKRFILLTLIVLSMGFVANAQQAKIAANAFGQFAAALEDFDATQLFSVIPDFHHLAKRVDTLKKVANLNKCDRLKSAKEEVDFCLSQNALIDELETLKSQLPLRACHNDTKINNLLFWIRVAALTDYFVPKNLTSKKMRS